MLGQTRDNVEREIAALKLRIGVKHDRNVDRVGDGAKVGFDLRILEREVGFENCENAVDAEFLAGLRLFDCIGGHGRRDTCDHRHAFCRRLDRRLHDRLALCAIEIGEFAGRAKRRQAMHAGLDEVGRELAKHVGEDFSFRIDRRDEIGEYTVEIAHALPKTPTAPRVGIRRNDRPARAALTHRRGS